MFGTFELARRTRQIGVIHYGGINSYNFQNGNK